MTEPKLAGIQLAPGVLRRHMVVFLLCAFLVNISFLVVSSTLPWVLSNIMHVPKEQQGQTTGQLMMVHEIILILIMTPLGLLADRVGRRALFSAGFVVIGVSFALFGFVTDVPTLFGARALNSVGTAACLALLAIVLADYPTQTSRGKASGLSSAIGGTGAIVLFLVLMKVPSWIVGGRDPSTVDMVVVGRQWFFLFATIAGVGAALSWALRKDDAGGAQLAHKKVPFKESARQALFIARRDPLIALGFLTAIVTRGDNGLVGAFLLLWINQHAASVGLSPADAAKAGGAVLGIAGVSVILLAPVVGWLCDRVARIHVLIGGMVLAFAGFAGMHFINDPLGPLMKLCVFLSFQGCMTAGIASQATVAERAPAALRASLTGVYSGMGALGILVFTSIGGYIFDGFGPSAPFLFFAGWNAVVIGVGIWVAVHRVPPPVQLEDTGGAPAPM